MSLITERKLHIKSVKNTCFKLLVFFIGTVFATLTFLFVGNSTALAADGDLDTSMTGWKWEDGIRINPTSARKDGAYDVMAKADGTWTVGGYWSNANNSSTANSWFIRQYDSVGGGTSTFSGNPKDRLFFSPRSDHQRETLAMTDGRYAMIGYAGTHTSNGSKDYDCIVSVRQADGDLDTTGFNSSGTKAATVTMGTNAAKGRMWVAFSTSKDDKCISGDIASDNKILVCGHVDTSSNGEDVGIARVTSDGALDTTFSGDGKVTVDWNGDDICRALRLQSDGKIIIGGTTNNQGSSGDAFVARYNTDGTIDTSFSSDGIHTFDTGDNHRDLLMDLQIQSDGKIVAGGYIDSPRDGWVARLNTDGTMDTSFGGGDGVVTTQFGTNDHIQALAIAADGKILAGGWTDGFGTGDDFLVAKFTTAGAIDTSFGGGDGFSAVDLGQHSMGTAGNDDIAYGIDISPVTGSVMLAGRTHVSGVNYNFSMATFQNSLEVIANPPSGFEVVNGPVDDDELQGLPAEVVKTTPLCAGGEWTFDHDTPGIATRQYVIQDSALAASGLGVGEYIKNNFHDGTSTMPTHNLLWVASNIDHDGNTAESSQYFGAFKIVGWVGNQTTLDVANAADPITFKLFSDGNFKWKKNTTPETWVDSNVDYDGAGASPTGVIPTGWSIYLAFAAKNATTHTLPNHALNVTQANCDVAGFTRTPATATVSEAGTTTSFTVVLDSQPSGNVVFDVASSDTGEASVSVAQLTFTNVDWATPQTVTVTGVDDSLDDGDQNSTVTLAINAGSTVDSSYDALANQTVAVTTVDDDGPGFTISATTATVSEAGTTATVTVVLDSQPVSDVVISVTSPDTGEVAVGSAQVRFTNSNWDTPQNVVVTGVDETSVDGDQTTAVTFSVVDASSADNFDPVADQTVTVTTTDDDVALSPTPTPTTTTMPTSSTTTAPPAGTVSLSAAPTGDNGVLNWAASDSGNVASFSLAHRDPTSGSFSNINTFSGATLDHIATGLADGSHSFRILAVYNDGSAIASNVATINVLGGVVVGPVVTTPPTTVTPSTTTTSTTTTVAPTTTTTTTTTAAPATTAPATTTTPASTTTVVATTTTTTTTTTAAPATTAPATTTTLVVQLTVVPPDTDTATLSAGLEEIVTEQALEEAGSSDSEIPAGLIAAGAGLLAAAGLYLSRKWWMGLLAGTALGMLILALFGRRPPGMPEDFEVFQKIGWEEDETGTVITWSEPEKGGKVTSYILQGFKDNKWLIVGEYDDETFTDTMEPAKAEEVERWRMYAKGPGGTGKKTKSEDGLDT